MGIPPAASRPYTPWTNGSPRSSETQDQRLSVWNRPIKDAHLRLFLGTRSDRAIPV
jgi:hypothetical protein